MRLDRTAVHHDSVSNRYVIADNHRVLIQHPMRDRTILNICMLADPDEMNIPTNDTVEPNAGMVSDLDIADDFRALCDKHPITQLWQFSFVFMQHRLVVYHQRNIAFMRAMDTLRVVILKPSKYGTTGHVERFRRGFMPNSTVPYMKSMTPESIGDVRIEAVAIDEYVRTDLDYLDVLRNPDRPTLLALVGVQSHQFQRSLDLAAFAQAHGVRHCVIGGPHPMTCDTTMLHNRGISFALSEAETIWPAVLHDAIRGELQPAYGADQRWAQELHAPVLTPPSKQDLKRYVVPMIGVYPARGCPYTCNFCSVIKIAGRQIRSQPIETNIASLRRIKKAGIRLVMFTSDNFNKYPEAVELLEQMVEEKIGIPFFVQCDTQVSKSEAFIELLGRAGCFQMFVGVESFSRKTLLAAHKTQNWPEQYAEIARLCRKYGIMSHFSNIIGFPDDTHQTVREHMDYLRRLKPDVASFYVLTPIPGTEQYGDFLSEGRITETNLDRFDTSAITWTHPTFRGTELLDLVYECYEKFFSSRQIVRSIARGLRPSRISPGFTVPYFAVPIFMRWSASRRTHPMSGGVGHVIRDSEADYLQLRRSTFGFDRVPLPQNLQLSSADAELNRKVKIAI